MVTVPAVITTAAIGVPVVDQRASAESPHTDMPADGPSAAQALVFQVNSAASVVVLGHVSAVSADVAAGMLHRSSAAAIGRAAAFLLMIAARSRRPIPIA